MILLDTIAYNTFLSSVRGENGRRSKDLNEENFKNFILNYDGLKLIHSATLFELYIRDLKSNDINNFNKFIQDFNALKKYGFKILNENSWNFDWQSLDKACKNGESYDMNIYLEKKVDYEVISISRYFMYILKIVCDKLFDEHGDEIGLDLFAVTMTFNNTLIESKLKHYLFSYYLTDENKEISRKRFDNLLGYVLVKLEEIIKYKLTLTKMFTDPQTFLEEQYYDYDNLDQLNINGIQKARGILNGLKGKQLNQLIINTMNEIEAQVISENRRFFTDNEKLYFSKMLLPKALQQGYLVTKNDFTDCSIFSAFDGIENGRVGKFITFDKKLQALSKENNIFYDKEIYNQFLG